MCKSYVYSFMKAWCCPSWHRESWRSPVEHVVLPSGCAPELYGAVVCAFGFCSRDGSCREEAARGSFNAPKLAVTCPCCVLESWPSFKAPCRGHLMASHRRVVRSDGEPSMLGRCQCIKWGLDSPTPRALCGQDRAKSPVSGARAPVTVQHVSGPLFRTSPCHCSARLRHHFPCS